jgi:hypothetical protein
MSLEFQIQQTSKYGTSTPVVARTFYQGCEILRFFNVSEAQREEAKGVLQELQRQLVRCVEICDSITQELVTAHEEVKAKGFEFQSSSRAVTMPSVPDLQSQADSFLQSAKLATRETALLVKPFYGEKHDHRYHKLSDWAEKQFGPDDKFTQVIKHWEPWVKTIVDMRNAVDHPNDRPGGKLLTENFRLGGTPTAPLLIDPTWGLSGQLQQPIVTDMNEVIEGVIQLGEEVLVCLFYKLKGNLSAVIRQIPAERRDPICPVRLRVEFEQDHGHA